MVIGKKPNYAYSEIIFYQSRLKQMTITNQFLDMLYHILRSMDLCVNATILPSAAYIYSRLVHAKIH